MELIKLNNDPMVSSIKDLKSIYGVGTSMAKKLYRSNIKSVAELNKHKEELKEKKIINDSVIMGLKYRTKLYKEIPEKIIDDVVVDMKKAAVKTGKECGNKLTVQLCGSAARYKITHKNIPKDIDILLLVDDKKSTNDFTAIMKSLFTNLFANSSYKCQNIIVSGKTKTSVVIEYNSLIFKIDLRAINAESKYTAIMYFTGPKLWNIRMRHIASHMGYKLSEYGLEHNGKMIPIKNDNDIFKTLNMEPVSMESRDLFS